MKAKLGKGVDLDIQTLVESRLLIQANSGSGKSWTVRRFVEQTYGKVQQIIIDPDGEYHTLREKFDFILAGKDGDCPADIRSAALLAKKLLELEVSAIIDIYELGQQRAMFVQRFLTALVNAPRSLWHPVVVIVDEAHKFCPEKEKSISTSSVVDLMTLGRKRGFCGVLATQRIAKLNKDAAAECNNKLIGRTSLDIDMKRAADELGFTSKEDRLKLRTLEAGQFYAYGPALSADGVKLFKVGDVETTHLRAGQRAQKPPPPPAKVKKLLGQLADLPHEAEVEARSMEELQTKYRSLEAELRAAKKAAPKTEIKTETKTIEKQVIKAGDLKRLEALTKKLESRSEDLQLDASRLDTTVTTIKEIANRVAQIHKPQTPAQKLHAEFLEPPEGHRKARTNADQGHHSRTNGVAQHVVSHAPSSHRRTTPVPVVSADDRLNLPKGEIAILTALIQFPEGCTGRQLSVLTGYTQTSRDAYITRLIGKGLATRDRPGHAVAIQPAASQALPVIQPLPTGSALRDYWLNELPKGERAVFELVVEAYPNTITSSEISERTGYTQTSRDAYITRMVSKEIMDRVSPGVIKASPTLFD